MDLDTRIETLGLDFQITTRLTSWVAVTEEATVDPLHPLRRERIPQALPAGLSAAGLGLRGHRTVLRLVLRMLVQKIQTHDPDVPFDLGMELDEFRGHSTMPPRRLKRRHELRGRIVLRRDR